MYTRSPAGRKLLARTHAGTLARTHTFTRVIPQKFTGVFRLASPWPERLHIRKKKNPGMHAYTRIFHRNHRGFRVREPMAGEIAKKKIRARMRACKQTRWHAGAGTLARRISGVLGFASPSGGRLPKKRARTRMGELQGFGQTPAMVREFTS